MRGVSAYVGENVCDIVSVGLVGKVELENILVGREERATFTKLWH